MARIIILCLLLFVSSFSFSQTANNNKSILASEAKESIRQDDSFFSLDDKNENLIIPSDNNGFKVYGIKIFDSDGNETISEKIDPALNPNSIDVSKLSDGEYIVHLVTVEQALYRTKLVIKR